VVVGQLCCSGEQLPKRLALEHQSLTAFCIQGLLLPWLTACGTHCLWLFSAHCACQLLKALQGGQPFAQTKVWVSQMRPNAVLESYCAGRCWLGISLTWMRAGGPSLTAKGKPWLTSLEYSSLRLALRTMSTLMRWATCSRIIFLHQILAPLHMKLGKLLRLEDDIHTRQFDCRLGCGCGHRCMYAKQETDVVLHFCEAFYFLVVLRG
jgi:hypothetical protein